MQANRHRSVTKGTGATLRDGDQKFDENETAAFGSALGSVLYVALDRLGILYATKTVTWFMQSSTKSANWQAQARGAICWGALRSYRSTPGKVCRSTWMCTATATGQARSGNAGALGLRKSLEVIRSTVATQSLLALSSFHECGAASESSAGTAQAEDTRPAAFQEITKRIQRRSEILGSC